MLGERPEIAGLELGRHRQHRQQLDRQERHHEAAPPHPLAQLLYRHRPEPVGQVAGDRVPHRRGDRGESAGKQRSAGMGLERARRARRRADSVTRHADFRRSSLHCGPGGFRESTADLPPDLLQQLLGRLVVRVSRQRLAGRRLGRIDVAHPQVDRRLGVGRRPRRCGPPPRPVCRLAIASCIRPELLSSSPRL